jgi:hypothetical protein
MAIEESTRMGLDISEWSGSRIADPLPSVVQDAGCDSNSDEIGEPLNCSR